MYKCLHYECFKTLTNNYYKTLLGDYDWIKFRWLFSRYKCTKHQFIPVSYTHLTLPTNREV